MKLSTSVLTAVSLVALTSTCFAKKAKGGHAPSAPSASEVISRYDKNGDTKLDEAELAEYLKDHPAASPKKKHKKK